MRTVQNARTDYYNSASVWSEVSACYGGAEYLNTNPVAANEYSLIRVCSGFFWSILQNKKVYVFKIVSRAFWID